MNASPREPTDADLLAAYHRTDRIRTIVRIVVGAVAAVVAVTLGAFVTSSSPALPSASSTDGIPNPVATSSPTSSPEASDSRDRAALALPEPPPNQLGTTAPIDATVGTWQIAIATSGYQAELDACQWVRMDLGAAAPIAGAHTSCGGAIVIEMAIDDAVTLSGQGLDGSYLVTAARDAHVGDVASTATEGMDAVVILQTCYPGSGGRLRLLALQPV